MVAVVTVAVLTAGFFINDGPRRSGMLDVFGVTCGEFVVNIHSGDEQLFESWQDHPATLAEAAAEQPAVEDGFAPEIFIEDVEAAAAEADAEPVHAVFTGWAPADRQFSVAAVGGELLIGHHPQMWTVTEAVSSASPHTGELHWTAELEHPLWEDWQNPERVLYGVGSAGGQPLLQTPTASGDTDLLVLGPQDGQVQKCVRLEGQVNPVDVLQEQRRAWPVVMNLNLGRLSDDVFSILHGLDPETDEPLLVSEVDISAGESEVVGEYAEYSPSALEYAEVEQDSLGSYSQLDVDDLKPLGSDHLLLTWESGSIILERR